MWQPPISGQASEPEQGANPRCAPEAEGVQWPLSPEQVLAGVSPSEKARLKLFVAWWRQWDEARREKR